jgi:hypothetical protein
MDGLLSNSDSKLLSQQSGQAGLVSEIDPVTRCSALLLLLRLAQHDPIESLGTADGRAQPDLLGWGLLVDNVGAVRRVDDVEDAGLGIWSADCKRYSKGNAYRVLDINAFLLFCQLLSSGDEFLEVMVCSLVVLFDLNGCRLVDLVDGLSLLELGLVGVGQDAFVGTRGIGEVASSDV